MDFWFRTLFVISTCHLFVSARTKDMLEIFLETNSGKRTYNRVNIAFVTAKHKHDTNICYFETGKNKNLMMFSTVCSLTTDYQCFTPHLWRKQLHSFARA